MTIKPAFQEILKGILHTEDENKPSHERIEIIKSQEKSKQIISEWHKISCTYTNPYTTKTTKRQESPHTSQ
jgi:hypothetical protein